MARYAFDACIEEELAVSWNYIAQDNPEAATRVIEVAHETFRILADNPQLGRRRRFRSSRLRDIRSYQVTGFKNYLVFYRIIPEGIQVIHIFHGARDLESLFDETA